MTAAEEALVLDLLNEAERIGVGVAFLPDGDGWEIAQVDLDNWPAVHDFEMGMKRLADAYNLSTAVAAALKPLRSFQPQLERYRAWRAEREEAEND